MIKISEVKIKDYNPEKYTKKEVAEFLFTHLDKYGDPIEDILKSFDYLEKRGGFILTAEIDDKLIGALVVNDTGMHSYIPDHILVYIAVDSKQREQGIGGKLIQAAKKMLRRSEITCRL